MADCFHTTYRLEAGQSFGFHVDWTQHPKDKDPLKRVVKIVTVRRNCIFNTDSIQLKVGDIITEINDKEITSIDVFRRKRKTRTTFRKLLQDEEEEEPDPQPQHLHQPLPAPLVTDRATNTTRKRQRNEQLDNDNELETNANEEHPPEPSPVVPNELYRSPSPPPPQEGFSTPAAANIPIPIEPPKVRGEILLHPTLRCEGLTKGMLSAYNCRDIDDVLRGFDRLVGSAMRLQASYISRHGCENASYADTTIGYIPDKNKKDEDSYSWEAVRIGNEFSFHRMSCRKNLPHGDAQDVGVADGTSCCCDCYQHRGNFVRLCRTEEQLYMEHERGNVALKNHSKHAMRWHLIHTRNSFKMTVGFGTLITPLTIENSFYGSYLNLQDT